MWGPRELGKNDLSCELTGKWELELGQSGSTYAFIFLSSTDGNRLEVD
jgi:hypothetical protein